MRGNKVFGEKQAVFTVEKKEETDEMRAVVWTFLVTMTEIRKCNSLAA